MKRFSRAVRATGFFSFIFFYNLAATYAATEYLPENYLLVRADVNGDRYPDAIAQPRRRESEAAVLLGRNGEVPEELWQRLDDIDPELGWDAERSVLVAADFNGDGRDDVFLQSRARGGAQAILLASSEGRFKRVNQKFAGEYMGFDWAADLRYAIAGDFDGNGHDELLMQGYREDDIQRIIRPNGKGTLNTTGPSWVDGHLDLRWHAAEVELHAGDFNGDRRTDLLWRRKADAAAVTGEPLAALLLADDKGGFSEIAQEWEEDFLGAEWDPATHGIRIADINGDGIADIVLRSHQRNGTNYLVPGRMEGRLREVALQWHGEESAEHAWAHQPGSAPDIVMHAEQMLSSDSDRTSGASSKTSSSQMMSSSGPGSGVVGTLPGEFSVDATGAANYRIPIEVPPGVSGMQPDLAILYSSRGGNGLLGVGWSLSGLSSITRCPESKAQSGTAYKPVTYSNKDSFCLDGQLLKLKDSSQIYGGGGVVYGTEISSFQRVTSHTGSTGNNGSDIQLYTGPEYFIVKDKSGLIREYGRTGDSRVRSGNKPAIKQWALNKIRDRFGNQIRYVYEHGSKDNMSGYWPKRIEWSNRNGYIVGRVGFTYDDRPDVTAGSDPFECVLFACDSTKSSNSVFKRLASIDVQAKDASVRTYYIEYKQLVPSGLSSIGSVRLCAPSGSCMPATRFTWTSSTAGLESNAKRMIDAAAMPITLPAMRFGDANGDSRTDIFFSRGGKLQWYDVGQLNEKFTNFSLGESALSNAAIMDYNRDGRTDFVISHARDWPLDPLVKIILSEGSDDYSLLTTDHIAWGVNEKAVAVDIDNDGFQDLVTIAEGKLWIYRNGPNGFQSPYLVEGVSVSAGQRIFPIEYNGDGLPDLIINRRSGDSSTGGVILTSNGMTFKSAAQNFATENIIPADFNGDGLTDFVAQGGPLGTSSGGWYTFINKGGFLEVDGPQMAGDYKQAKTIDWDRDGRADLLIPTSTGWVAKPYRPELYTRWGAYSTQLPKTDADRFIVAEFDGDGMEDVVFNENDEWKRRLGAGDAAGLLVHAVNGLGHDQIVRYWDIPRTRAYGNVYLGHSPGDVGVDYYTINPEMDEKLNPPSPGIPTARYVLPPISVVSAIEIDTGIKSADGAEGRVTSTYRYAGAVHDLTGRGFLGFRMVKVRNANTGIKTANIHRQEFPFTGMVERTIQKMSDKEYITNTSQTGTPGGCRDENGSLLPADRCGFEYITETSISSGFPVSESINTFAKASAAQTADGGIFPYVKTTVETSYHFPWSDETTMPPKERLTTTTYTYGAAPAGGAVTGDPTYIEVITTDGSGSDRHAVTTVNSYNQNVLDASWCLGRLTESTVAHVRTNYLNQNPADVTETRKARFGYDQSVRFGSERSCRLIEEVGSADAVADDGTPLQVTKTYGHDAFGNTERTSVAPAAGGLRETWQIYDESGLFPRVTKNGLGHQEFYVWDRRFGKKLSSTGPNGLTTVWRYDEFGRVLREVSPRPAAYTDYQYRWCSGDCASVNNAVYYTKSLSSVADKTYSIVEYDSLGREVARYQPAQHVLEGRTDIPDIVVETVYDTLGRAYLKSLPYVKGETSSRCWTHTLFDLLDRPTTVSQPVSIAECDANIVSEETSKPRYGKNTRFFYPGIITVGSRTGVGSTVRDPLGREKTTVKNVLDRTLVVAEKDGTEDVYVYFDYNALGNTSIVVSPGDSVLRIIHDDADRKVWMSDPDMGVWTYEYNGFGELKKQTDALGNVTEMTYDGLGRMSARTDRPALGDPQTTEWIYDIGYGAGTGKLAQVVKHGENYSETYAYNEYGETTDTVRMLDGKVYWTSQSYDDWGRPDILVYPDVETFDAQATPLQPVNLDLVSTSNGKHEVTWTPASAIANYSLLRSNSDNLATAVAVYTGPLKRHDDTVDADGSWYYWVKSCHAETCRTDGPVSTQVTLPPDAPQRLQVEGYDDEQDGGIELTWSASDGATSYTIHRATTFDGAYEAVASGLTSTSTTVSGHGDGVYYFRILACEGGSCSDPTQGDNGASVVLVPPVTATPAIDPSLTTSGSTNVSWPTSLDPFVDEYDLQVLQLSNLDGSEMLKATLTASDASRAVEGLAPGEFRFKVRACKNRSPERICGSWSNASEILRSGEKPQALPAISSPSIDDDGAFTVTFENPRPWEAAHLEIEEAADSGFTQYRRTVQAKDVCYGEPDMGYENCDAPTSIEVTASRNGNHWYRIRACNGDFGCSDWTVASAPTDVRKAPSAPESISAPGVSPTGSFGVNWEAPLKETVDKYELYEAAGYYYFSHSDPTPYASLIYSGTGLGHPVSGKADGTIYSYGIRACYKSACSSFISASVRVVFPPPAPSAFSVPQSVSSGDYTLYWSETERTQRYHLEEFVDPALVTDESAVGVRVLAVADRCEQTEPDGTCTHFPYDSAKAYVEGRSEGTYYYRVKACNAGGCSAWTVGSNGLDVNLPPSSISQFDVPTRSDGTHTLSWSASTGVVTRYEVYESTSSDHSGGVRVHNAPETSVTLSGRSDGAYYYRVRGCNVDSCAAFTNGSDSVSVVNIPGAPSAMTIPTSSVSGDYAVSWGAASGIVDDYVLQESTSSSFATVANITVPKTCTQWYKEQGIDPTCMKYTPDTSVNISGRGDGMYYYRVRACNTTGCSAWTAGANGINVLLPPGSPASISVPANSAGSHTVSWTAAGGTVARYELYESTSSSFSSQTRVYNNTGMSVTLSGRADGTYYYRVRACNASGCSGYRSGGNYVSVVNEPGVPGTMSIPSSNSTGSYSVSWGASSGVVTSYQLQESTSSSFSSVTSVSVGTHCAQYDGEGKCFRWEPNTYASISGKGDGTYYYRVRGCNSSGCSGWRTGGNAVTVLRAPGTPSSITAPTSSSSGSFTISWGTSTGTVTAYQLYQSTSSSFSSQVRIYSGTGTSKSVSGYGDGTYYFRVRACNGSSCSAYRSGAYTTVKISTGGGGGSCDPNTGICSDPQSGPSEPTMLMDNHLQPIESESTAEYLRAEIAAASGYGRKVAANDDRFDLAAAQATTEDSAAVLKVAAGSDIRNDFAVMPPMRPADFYRGLSTPASAGRITQNRAALRAVKTTADRAPAETGTFSKLSKAQQGAALLTFDAKGNVVPGQVEKVAPLRNDPRISGRRSGDTRGRSGKTDSSVTLMKFGITNEPEGTYAHAVKHEYHALTGALWRVRECAVGSNDSRCDDATGQIYWEAQKVTVHGALTDVRLGNGFATTRNYDPLSGAVTGIHSINAAGSTVQRLGYQWDIVGNLRERRDYHINGGEGSNNGGFVESFVYDSLYRLVETRMNYNITGLGEERRLTRYRADGGIRCFNVLSTSENAECGTDDYIYDSTSHPHAVRLTSASGTPYGYDENGSMTSGPDRSISWTSFNKPFRIENTANGAYAEFSYGPQRTRYKQETQARVTYYVGSAYERVIDKDTGEQTHRFHIFAGGNAVAVYSCTVDCGRDPEGTAAEGTRDETYYFLRDHLGSISAIADGHGTVREEFNYSAWGRQQRWDLSLGTYGELGPAGSALQSRGYTGHEMLNELSLIHMNGRIYDQNLGRFISADPFVQFAESTQGYNRYTYVNNNPLSYTDPSGYLSLKEVFKVVAIAAISYYTGGLAKAAWGGLAGAATGGAVAGYLSTGTLEGAMLGMVGGMAAYGIGHQLFAGSENLIGKSLTHGMAQGALSKAGGGRFGDGFLGGFTGSLLGPIAENFPAGPAQTIGVAIIGGTVSRLGGGSFANGAVSAAFVNMFNDQGESINPDMCGDDGTTCDTVKGERVVEEKVHSGTVLVDTSSSTANKLVNSGLDIACEVAKGCKFLTTIPDQAVVVDVDLMAVYEVQDVVVKHRGVLVGTFPGRKSLTGYREYRSGEPYVIPISEGIAVPRVINWNVESDVPLYRWRGD